MSFDNIMFECDAAGSVGSDGSTVVVRGALVARSNTGIYTVTLDKLADATNSIFLVSPRTTGDIALSVVHTSATVKTINARTIAQTTAAADCAFDFACIRITGGTGR